MIVVYKKSKLDLYVREKKNERYAALLEAGAESIRFDGPNATAYLGELSPLAFLSRLEGSACPIPSSIEYGRFKMEELYRDLYGVGGI